jgi:hypothetical protein
MMEFRAKFLLASKVAKSINLLTATNIKPLTIGHNYCMILGTQVRLHALAIGSSSVEDMCSRTISADKRDGPDSRMVADVVDDWCGSMHNVNNTRREP